MTTPPEEAFPCPCCGHLTLSGPWTYDICSVCVWEEDVTQLVYPWCGMGPNHGLSLIEAQANYARIGAVNEEMLRYARPARDDEPLDPGFRPVDPDRDPYPREFTKEPLPEDFTELFYWRPTYRRRHLA